MKYSVYWTQGAVADLEEIVAYMSKVRVSTAKSIYQKIKLKCNQLNVSPERCRLVPELQRDGLKNYREIILAPYRVVFKLAESKVYIIAVIDGRR